MCELYVCTADNFDRIYYFICLLLQTLLEFFGNGEHRCGTERIARMNAKRIDIFYKADCYHIAVFIAYNFKFKLFPAEDRLLNKHLTYKACLKTSCTDRFKLVLVVYKSAACAAHGVCGTKNNGITKLVGDGKRLVNGVGNVAACHFYAELVHSLLKFYTILAALDSIYLNADDLYIVFIKYALFVKLGAEVKTRLSAKVWQKCIGALLCDYLLKSLYIKRLYICNIRHFGVCHYSCGVRVYQHDLIAKAFERLAGLCAGVVKFTRLSDDDRTRAYYQDLVYVSSFWHFCTPPELFQIFLLYIISLYLTNYYTKFKKFLFKFI